MKKTMSKIIALIAVAAMIFSLAACTQTLNVRFVDGEGNDIDLKGVFGGGTAVEQQTQGSSNNETPTAAPSSEAPTTPPAGETPTTPPTGETPTAAPEAPTAAGETPTTAPEAPTAAGEAPTAAPEAPTAAPASSAPATKAEILDFYKNAVARVKNNGEAAYNKKEWQALGALEGFGSVESTIQGLVDNYMTPEGEASVQACAKGSDEAKDRFPNFVLTDYSKVTEATLTTNASGNYEIKIVLQAEDTPTKANNFIGQCTNSVLWWEDIEAELKNISVISGYENIHVIYDGFTITAEITPAGNFVSMRHYCPIKISIGSVKILIVNLKDKAATLENFASYSDFAY